MEILTRTLTSFLIYGLLNGVVLNQKIVSIGPQSSMTFIFDLTSIYQENCNSTMLILDAAENRVLMSQTIESLYRTSEGGLKRIAIYNFQNEVDNFTINIVNDIQNMSSSSIQIDDLILKYQRKKQKNQFNILMLKDDINNFILPFNLLNQKMPQFFVEESKQNFDYVIYENQPYLGSDHGSDQLLLQWLPYFSSCTYRSSNKIFLNDLFYPWKTDDFDLFKGIKTCNAKLSWFWGIETSCPPKTIRVLCMLEELTVQNRTKQPWWKNTENTLYYFVKPNAGDVFNLAQNSPMYLSDLSHQYYKSLVPLIYQPNFDFKRQNPNSFKLNLNIANINSDQIQILQANLKASVYGQCEVESYAQICLEIDVNYLSSQETFSAYAQPTIYYYLFFGLISIGVFVVCKVALNLMKINLRFLTICKLSLYPIMKGYFIAFCLSTAFVLSLYYIAESTKYKAIVLDFDSAPLTEQWNSYAGRVGATTLLSGYFLLNMGIEKAFKVLTQDETRMTLQDEKSQKKSDKVSGSSKGGEDEEGKQNFIINTMNSHRRYLLLSVFLYIMVIVSLYYVKLNFDLAGKFAFVLIGYPVVHKLIISLYRHLFGKQLLYLSSILISLHFLLDMDCIGNMLVFQSILFYCVRLVSQNMVVSGLQILSEWFCIKAYNYISVTEHQQRTPSVLFRVLNMFKMVVGNVVNQSSYEKSLFYVMLMNVRVGVVLSRIFLWMMVWVSVQYNFICKDLHRTQHQLINSYSILFCFFPIQIIIMILSIKFYEKVLGLKLIKCLEINKFKFNKRKIRWINDSLHQNKCLNRFYRELERFCFSSQLYIIVFLMVFAIDTIIIGYKIMIQVNFIVFGDPAILLIIVIVWFSGSISSIIINFIAIKCKLYQRKASSRMISKLQSIQSTSKTINYEQYLQTQAIKNYFLMYCKTTIMDNIHKIFQREDFTQNGNEMLKKFNSYRQQIKRKEIQQRKKIQRNKEQKQNTKCMINERKNKNIVVRFSGNDFNLFVKPLIYSWLYLAKQFTFLKTIITQIREKNKKQCCQYCSTGLELQVIEQKQFAEVVNDYRLLNVGRLFHQDHFACYYELNQKFVTVCSECKEKKKHIQKKELPLCRAQKYLVVKWLIMARSRLLHRQHCHKGKNK